MLRVFALEASGLPIHDCHMTQRLSFILTLFLLTLLPVHLITAAESGPEITITEYEHEDYFRHPRMEEEDRLRGRTFQFQPGLEIISNIDDTEIEFFEERIGKTPWEQDNLKAGAYRVRLERTGYEVVEFWVTVRSDRRTVVLVNMGEPTGSLVVYNLPPGAVVTIDRVPVESAEGSEITAAAGRRLLKVSAFGWETVQNDIDIPSGGLIEWRYEGTRTAFQFGEIKIRPQIIPPDDKRGVAIQWNADSGGSADMSIFSPDGALIAVIPFAVSSARGSITWVPGETQENLTDGRYKVVFQGTGYDSNTSVGESSFELDSRFRREPRPLYSPLPGLLYAGGTVMLPKGIWQASTAAGVNFGGGGIPVDIAVRFSPARRLEFSGKFHLTARDPFDETSIGMDFSGSWRANPGSGPFSVNLALLFSYEGYASDFGSIPGGNPGMSLPGLQFAVPMEFRTGNWNFILSPSLYLFFPGNNPARWQFSGPARMTESIGMGFYYENGRFLLGVSAALRGPDHPQEFLETSLWTGVEGRFDLPGDASYLVLPGSEYRRPHSGRRSPVEYELRVRCDSLKK